MQIDIQTSRLTLAPEHREQIRRRVTFALARLHPHVARVEVRLTDINGTRGGVDKQCRVLVHMTNGPSAIVEDRDSDLLTLIGRALRRAGRLAAKRVKRGAEAQYLPRARMLRPSPPANPVEPVA